MSGSIGHKTPSILYLWTSASWTRPMEFHGQTPSAFRITVRIHIHPQYITVQHVMSFSVTSVGTKSGRTREIYPMNERIRKTQSQSTQLLASILGRINICKTS